MKRILWLSGFLAMFLGLVSCDKNPIDVMIKGGDNIYVNPNTHWTNSNTPAYIGDISAYPAALQEVIRQRFPKQVSMETAGANEDAPGFRGRHGTALCLLQRLGSGSLLYDV